MSFTINGLLTKTNEETGQVFKVPLSEQCLQILINNCGVQVVNVNLVNVSYEKLEGALNGTLLRCSKHGRPVGVAGIWHV